MVKLIINSFEINKPLLVIFSSFLALMLFMGLAFGTAPSWLGIGNWTSPQWTYNQSVSDDQNVKEWYSSCPFPITLVVNDTDTILGGSFNVSLNEMILGDTNYTVDHWLTNSSGASYIGNITNGTLVCFKPNGNQTRFLNITVNRSYELFGNNNVSIYNISFNTTPRYNQSVWWGFRFWINEFANQSNIITPIEFTNGSIINETRGISITTSKSAQQCGFVWNNSALVLLNRTTSTAFGNRTIWSNTSQLDPKYQHADTNYDKWFNITFKCRDAYGNQSWLNDTNVLQSQPNFGNTTNVVYFKVDTIDPVVTFDSLSQFSAYNITNKTNSSTWTFFFNYTDRNPLGCGLRIFRNPAIPNENETITGYLTLNTSLNYTSSGTQQGNCTVVFNPNNITSPKEGITQIKGFGTDLAGRVGTTSTNMSVILRKLYNSKWNMITFTGANYTTQNETMSEFVRLHAYTVTIVSVWNNTYKNFTTYSTSAPTVNRDYVIRMGTALLTYSNADYWMLSPDFLTIWNVVNKVENVTFTNATSANAQNSSTPWNMIGFSNNVTLNRTLFACRVNSANDGGHLGSLTLNTTRAGTCNSTFLANFTYASWFNSSSNKYITCKRGMSACAGTAETVAQIYLPVGFPVWIFTSINVTINQTNVY